MTDSIYESAQKSLERIQKFDALRLPRATQLGDELNFKDALPLAERLIKLYQQFPIDFLVDIPDQQLTIIKQSADLTYNIFNRMLEFKGTVGEPLSIKNGLIQELNDQYQPIFNEMHPIIAYGATRQRDFAAMERDFRIKIQGAEDLANDEIKKLTAQNEAAVRILDEVRKVSAEQGVSQQAIYFKDESIEHSREATKWQKWTITTAAGLGFYAIISAFAHNFEWLNPKNNYQAFQLGLSKIFIFTVLAYMLILFARNFLSHKHNAIVNRHRQNALLTFNALVQAASEGENRDVILTYAAACIFSPQETGYTKSSSSGQPEMPLNIIQAIPKLASGSSSH